jgi:prolyl oligopeptidase
MVVNSKQLKLPQTPIHEVTDTYFGIKIADSYRWLEDLRARGYLVDEDAERLHACGARPCFKPRQTSRPDGSTGRCRFTCEWRPVIPRPLVYLKGAPGDDNHKLYARDGFGGSERLLLNPDSERS